MSNTVHSLPENWENDLERRLLQNHNDRCKKRAYICSPCNDASIEAVQHNIKAARFYMYYTVRRLHVSACAPHAYLPILLSDGIPAERALALRFCLRFMETTSEVFVCGRGISNGMHDEIERAAQLLLPIQVYDQNLYVDVRKIITRAGGSKHLVTCNPQHPELALSTTELFSEKEAYD